MISTTNAARGLAAVLIAFIPFAAAGYDAAQAVRDAAAVPVPDYAGEITSAETDEVLEGFGGGGLEASEEQQKLYQDGYGSLYDPAKAEVVACRRANTPECLAVQKLDKGFPERPVIDDSVLDGRDDVVDSVKPGEGGDGGVETCRDFIIESKPSVEIEACSSGGPFYDLSCSIGWADSGAALLTKWACIKGEGSQVDLSCRHSIKFGTTIQYKEKCFFGLEMKPAFEALRLVSARARAEYEAVCRAPQYEKVVEKCFDELQITPGKSCVLGESSKSSTTGDPGLVNDNLPGGDTLFVRIPCAAASSDRVRKAYVSINAGSGEEKLLIGIRSAVIAIDSVWSAYVSVDEHSCRGVDCIFKCTAEVYEGDFLRGKISVLHPYTGYDPEAQGGEEWIDGCRNIEGDHK